MTEYTGWDNYVKEQKLQKYLSGVRYVDWIPSEKEQQHLSEPSHGWNIPYAGPNYEPNRVDQLQERVKNLELHNKQIVDPDIIMLGQEKAKLREKVKDLEERITNYEANLGNFMNKVLNLEEWKRVYDSDLNEHLKRIRALEEWKQEHILQSPEHNPFRLDNRVRELEQWKRLHLTTSHFNKTHNNEMVGIDKKVWDDIKYESSLLNAERFSGRVGMIIGNLVGAIKRAEGDKD